MLAISKHYIFLAFIVALVSPLLLQDSVNVVEVSIFQPHEEMLTEFNRVIRKTPGLNGVNLHYCRDVEKRDVTAAREIFGPKLFRIQVGDYPAYAFVEKEAFDTICRVKSLKELSIYANRESEIDLSKTQLLTQLRELTIVGPIRVDEKNLASFPRVTELEILVNDLTTDFSWVSASPEIETLHLSAKKFPENIVCKLANLTKLSDLGLSGIELTKKHLLSISESCKNINSMDIQLADSEAVDSLAKFTELETLSIHVSGSGIVDLSFVCQLKRLKHLSIHGKVDVVINARTISAMKKLESVLISHK